MQAEFSITSSSLRRWLIWCNRSKLWTTLPPRHTGQSDSHSKPRLGVTESWRENGPSRSHGGASGPQRQEERVDWTWAAEETPDDLELTWLEWLREAEAAWCAFTTSTEPNAGISGEEQRVGHRAPFPRPGYARRNGNKKAAAWRSLRCLVAQAVGNLAAWRKGLTLLHTLQRSVRTVASISLPDLGPWDPGLDFPSQESLAHTLRNAAYSGDWAVQVTGVMLFIKSQTQQAVKRIRRVAGGNGRRKHARPGTSSPRPASTTCWSSWLCEAFGHRIGLRGF